MTTICRLLLDSAATFTEIDDSCVFKQHDSHFTHDIFTTLKHTKDQPDKTKQIKSYPKFTRLFRKDFTWTRSYER